MRVRQPDIAYKNRQEKVPITFIFLLSTQPPPPFAYFFLLYAYFHFVCLLSKRKKVLYASLSVCVCACAYFVYFGRLQNYNLQCKANKSNSYARTPVNYPTILKKKLKITNSKYGTKYFIWKDELDEVDCQ